MRTSFNTNQSFKTEEQKHIHQLKSEAVHVLMFHKTMFMNKTKSCKSYLKKEFSTTKRDKKRESVID